MASALKLQVMVFDRHTELTPFEGKWHAGCEMVVAICGYKQSMNVALTDCTARVPALSLMTVGWLCDVSGQGGATRSAGQDLKN